MDNQEDKKEKIFEEFPTTIESNTSFHELDSNFSIIPTKKDEPDASASGKNILDDTQHSPIGNLDLSDPMDFIIQGDQSKKAMINLSMDDDDSDGLLDLKSEDLLIDGAGAKIDDTFQNLGDLTNICDQKFEFDDLNVSTISQADTDKNDLSLLESFSEIPNELVTISNAESSAEKSVLNDYRTEADNSASFSTLPEKSVASEAKQAEQVILPDSNSLDGNESPKLAEQESAQVVTVESGSIQELAPMTTQQFVESPSSERPPPLLKESFPEPTVDEASFSHGESLKSSAEPMIKDEFEEAASSIVADVIAPVGALMQSSAAEEVQGDSVAKGDQDEKQVDEMVEVVDAAKPVPLAWNPETPTLASNDDEELDYHHSGNKLAEEEKEAEEAAVAVTTTAAFVQAVQSNVQSDNVVRTSPSPATIVTEGNSEQRAESTKGDYHHEDKFCEKTINEDEEEEHEGEKQEKKELDEPFHEKLVDKSTSKANSLEQSLLAHQVEDEQVNTSLTRPQHPSVPSFSSSFASSSSSPPPAYYEPKIMGRKNFRRDNSGDSEPELLGNDNLREWLQIVLGSCASDLLYWRDPTRTGPVFGAGLVILFALSWFSVISVIAYTLFLSLLGTLSFRIYKNILQAVQKTSEGHPFKEYLDLEITPSQERVHEIADQLLDHYNCFISKMRSVLLVEDIIDSVKYLFIFWSLTYIGSWFNGLTLVILAYIAAFSLPKVYELNKAQVDQYIDLVSTKLNEISDKLPFLKKAAEAEKKDD